MDASTFLAPLGGGVLIGGSAALLLAVNGRIAGVSGVVGELLTLGGSARGWRLAFLAGLLAGSAVLAGTLPHALAPLPDRPLPMVLLAGALVGFGTRMGNGCTSGHGVCGIPRGSVRSLVATLTFIGAGMVTTTALRLAALP